MPDEPSGNEAPQTKQRWRLRQRGRKRAPKAGDTIATQVGGNIEGANIVGSKNVIQFIGNTLSLPPRLAMVMVGLMTVMTVGLVSMGVIALMTFFHKPTRMGGIFNVAVADFGARDQQGRLHESDKAYWLSRWLAQRLNTALAGDKQLGIEVRHDEVNRPLTDPPIGLIQNEKEAEQQMAKLGADLLIYGNLTRPDDPASLQLQFALKMKPLQNEPDATIGFQVLGQAVTIPHLNDNLYKDAVDSDPNLALRTEALLWLVRGLVKDMINDHETALKTFLQATQTLSDQAGGKEIFYYLQGREARALVTKPGPFALAQQGQVIQVLQGKQAQAALQAGQARPLRPLDLAESAFLTATQINPEFVTAHIGLGNVNFDRAQLMLAGASKSGASSSTCQPAIQIDESLPKSWQKALSEIEQAVGHYQTAIAKARPLAPSYDLPIAQLMLGAAYQSAGYAYIKAEQEDHKAEHLLAANTKLSQATTILTATIQLFPQDQRYGFRAYTQYWLGEAYRAQGYIQQRQNEQAGAKAFFQQARQAYAQCSAPQPSPDNNNPMPALIRCYCQNREKNVAAILDKPPGANP